MFCPQLLPLDDKCIRAGTLLPSFQRPTPTKIGEKGSNRGGRRCCQSRRPRGLRSVEFDLGDAAPTDGHPPMFASLELELRPDDDPVDPDRPLAHEPSGRTGRGCKADVLEKLADPDLGRVGTDDDGGGLKVGAVLKASLEVR